MNKQDLINHLAKENGLSKAEAQQIVTLVFQSMTGALAQGGRVEIRGFGSFTVKNYKAYKGRNPKTGEPTKVPRKKLPVFRVGRELKRRVDFK
jgi:integration host factor subunit beta